jgi:hypothetical protein
VWLFQIFGHSEHRPNRELNGILLAPEYIEADNAWDGYGEWFYSVQSLVRVDPAAFPTLRKYFGG